MLSGILSQLGSLNNIKSQLGNIGDMFNKSKETLSNFNMPETSSNSMVDAAKMNLANKKADAVAAREARRSERKERRLLKKNPVEAAAAEGDSAAASAAASGSGSGGGMLGGLFQKGGLKNMLGNGNIKDKAFGAIGQAFDAGKEIFHKNRTGLQRSDPTAEKIKDAQYSILKKIPVTAPFARIAELADKGIGMITGGLGSATKADKVLTAMPLVGNIAAGFTGKTKTFEGNIEDINTGDFGGTVADSERAQAISGVKSVAKKRLNREIEAAQWKFDMADSIIDENKFLKNHNMSNELASSIQSKYNGSRQLAIGKAGMKFPDLIFARDLLLKNTLSNKTKDVQQFKSGGKLEKENIIPTGALHKNLHHIEDSNPELEGKITKKGIPVVSMGEGGEVSQTCEIESGEIVFSLDVTKQLEEYYNNYKESEDDNIAIECGKYLVDQILNNTRDDDKVIKKTE